MANQNQTVHAWHAETAEEVLNRLAASPAGLTKTEATRRRQEYGSNLLPEKGPTPLWLIVLRQFASPLIYILIVAAVISVLTGDVKDAAFIVAVLVVNGMIGAYQESQAEKSSFALRKLLRMNAQVEREGEVYEVSAEELVPGDIVWLESGNRVSADLRLLSTQSVEIDESLLTGESQAASKDSIWMGAPATTLADRRNMAYAGSMVARGRAKGVVVATGRATSVGQLAIDLSSAGGKPPLLARLERFTNHVAVGTIVAAAVIGGLGMFVGHYTAHETLLFVIALAVSAIPEGLPIAMTVALAVATKRMVGRNVIVRRLAAVEGLGSCTMIATDKTGTLTCNELTLRELRLTSGAVYQVTGEGFAPQGQVLREGTPVALNADNGLSQAVKVAILCNEAELHHHDNRWVWRGDAVDVALLSFGQKLGVSREKMLDALPQVNQIPFECEHQFSASFHREDEGTAVFVKGAPERVMAMCAADESGYRPVVGMNSVAIEMATRGLRVLAIAAGKLDERMSPADLPSRPKDLRLIGFLGMIDPLRPEARKSVADCNSAGVRVVMITGDHRVTAAAIARDLGLTDDESQVITADELAGKSEPELEKIVGEVRVFARVTPRQKLEIVNAARKSGHFVAVTGDGVNDAPALRAANIGVAMGKSGTDVAREAADLVISDDNFSSIVAGIEEGRIAYENIRKVIYLVISTGVAELLMVLLAVLWGLPLPLLAVQLLWLNLVTNGIQDVALAFEPGEGGELRRKPRPPNEPIFNRLMIERVIVGAGVIAIGGFAVFASAINFGWPVEEARNLLLLTMVLFEIVHIGNCRSETASFFSRSPLLNPVLFLGTIAAFIIHLAAMHIPLLQAMLSAQPVGWQTWGVAIAVSLIILPAIEIHKFLWRKREVPLAPR